VQRRNKAFLGTNREGICIYALFSWSIILLQISEAASASRSDDTAKLKSAILTYMHEDPKHGSRFKGDYDLELLIPGDSKDKRGFQHLDTAVHLCPFRLMDDFEKDPM
jgi:hypothetical protein